ncbi:Prefoldin subunit 6 [Mycoemilia scoparia]|uniref:Prefoldin subunit 6 n=1 Tax=Mycoemilia scoparia TaxID=417184 RepID=A0A9W8A9Z7_9FUNG|nr:Prefoldin subunit 6 [Mycoemilia scoparia]
MSIQKKFEDESYALQKLQKGSQMINSRRQLESQLQENKMVEEEFKLLKDNAKIYKLTGPVLLPQEKLEAVGNVEKRIEFINNETKRVENRIEELQKLQKEKIEQVHRLREEIQKNAGISGKAIN